jgi:hypothetical protein
MRFCPNCWWESVTKECARETRCVYLTTEMQLTGGSMEMSGTVVLENESSGSRWGRVGVDCRCCWLYADETVGECCSGGICDC